jgi:beta-glucosidase/6-phospho-beta-glucosidase/beta-galactosidase
MPKDVEKSILGAADFLGLNYYTSAYLNVDKTDKNPLDGPSWFSDCKCKQSADPQWKKGKNAWMHSVPQGLRSLLNWIKREYKNPKVFITENGWSDDGEINDNDRIDYFKSHLKALSKAIKEDDCNVVGYTAWSLLDCYEWNTGYTVKYGILSVNYTSKRRERREKKSVEFWREFLRRREIGD